MKEFGLEPNNIVEAAESWIRLTTKEKALERHLSALRSPDIPEAEVLAHLSAIRTHARDQEELEVAKMIVFRTVVCGWIEADISKISPERANKLYDLIVGFFFGL